mgnify:CR=1 FL=1
MVNAGMVDAAALGGELFSGLVKGLSDATILFGIAYAVLG